MEKIDDAQASRPSPKMILATGQIHPLNTSPSTTKTVFGVQFSTGLLMCLAMT
jgi:hypothetical protein